MVHVIEPVEQHFISAVSNVKKIEAEKDEKKQIKGIERLVLGYAKNEFMPNVPEK